MRAVFEPHQVRLDPAPGTIDLDKDGLPRVFDAHPETPTYLHIRGDEKRPDKDRVIPPGPPAFLLDEEFQPNEISLPADAHNPSLQEFVLKDHLEAAEREIAAAREAISKAQSRLAAVMEQTAHASPAAESAENENPSLFLHDEFAHADEAVWEIGPGEWKFAGGRARANQDRR
jgi:hypothetical protein